MPAMPTSFHTRTPVTCTQEEYFAGLFDRECIEQLYIRRLGFRACSVSLAASTRILDLTPPLIWGPVGLLLPDMSWMELGRLECAPDGGRYSFQCIPRARGGSVTGSLQIVDGHAVHEGVADIKGVLGSTISREVAAQTVERLEVGARHIDAWARRRRLGTDTSKEHKQ